MASGWSYVADVGDALMVSVPDVLPTQTCRQGYHEQTEHFQGSGASESALALPRWDRSIST